MNTAATLEPAINTAADAISRCLTEGVTQDLQTRIEDWRTLHGLDRLDDPQHVLARQAAFNVLLKGTLYEHYHQQGTLPELDDDTYEAFEEAAVLTGDPAFENYLLDDLARLVDHDAFEALIEDRHRLKAVADPAEEIGQLFELLTPQESRRKLGQFRTPPPIADLMATWCTPNGDERVLDPGMGAGALSAAAYRHKQQQSDDATLADIHGVDVNELSIVMGATALRLLDQGSPHNLQSADFLDLSPDDLDGGMDAVISNPPYTRHHELFAAYKTRVNAQIERELGRDVSALSTMYAYFYYHAAKFLTTGGRASFITPSEFLETGYGESLKQYLLDEYAIHALVLFDRAEDSVFDEALTTSLVSFLERDDSRDSDELVRFIRVDEYPGEAVLLDAISDGVEGETDWGFVNTVRQSQLEPEDKWTELFDPIEIDTSQLTPLKELATVTRGIATGANSYFCLSQDEVEEWELDVEYLSPLIRNARSVPYYDYRETDWEDQRDDGADVWLLYHLDAIERDLSVDLREQDPTSNAQLTDFTAITPTDDEYESSGIVRYLKHGMSEDVGAHDSYLAQNRDPWYVVDRREPAPILVTYMSRGGSRFILNETGARNLNNLHGIYPTVELSEVELKALLAYLNSGFADEVVRRGGRTYSTGMDKIEPNELERVPVLDPRGVENDAVTQLAQLFDELREAARSDDEPVDTVVAEIDTLLQRSLDYR